MERTEISREAFDILRDSGAKNIEMETSTIYYVVANGSVKGTPTLSKKRKGIAPGRKVVNRQRLPTSLLTLAPNYSSLVKPHLREFTNEVVKLIEGSDETLESRDFRTYLSDCDPLNMSGGQVSDEIGKLVRAGILEVHDQMPPAPVTKPNLFTLK